MWKYSGGALCSLIYFRYICNEFKTFTAMKRIITSLVLLAALSLPSWAQTDDPNIARADKMFGFVQADLADSLYANMADEVLDMVKKENLEGVFAKTEIMAGKYKSRDPWEKTTVHGIHSYVSMMHFERGELALLIVFNDTGKMLGIQIVPPETVKKG